MHIKIQGGGSGRMANTGSSYSLIIYLQHENLERQRIGKKVEQYFSHFEDKVDPAKIIEALDNNKKKLSKKDAKFFMITVSPSEEELRHLSTDPRKQADKMREFVRKHVMQRYAEAFNKGLNAEDLMYYGKIHHNRKGNKNKEDLHVHIVVSRKTRDGKRRISPQTNHKNTRKGPVKGGFSRVGFFERAEKSFDKRFLYFRKKENHFDYKKRYTKAKPHEIAALVKEKMQYNEELEQMQKEFNRMLKEKQISNNSLIDTPLTQQYMPGLSEIDSDEDEGIFDFDQEGNGTLGGIDFMKYVSRILWIAAHTSAGGTHPIQQKQEKEEKHKRRSYKRRGR